MTADVPTCEMPDCDNDAYAAYEAWPPREIAGREVNLANPIDLCGLCAIELEEINPNMFSGARTYGHQAEMPGPVTYDLT